MNLWKVSQKALFQVEVKVPIQVKESNISDFS